MYPPKFKLGDIVIAKGWFFYNQFIVISAFYSHMGWVYALGSLHESWFSVRHARGEEEIWHLTDEKLPKF